MFDQLQLRNFRCFEATSIRLHEETNLFLGRNAQGKTSLLEAACILLRLSSPRTSRLANALRYEKEGFEIAGIVDGHRLEFYQNSVGKRLLIDGTDARDVSEFISFAKVVWFGNSDLQLACGPGDLRRRFLDFVGAQIGGSYRKALSTFERALRSRNSLLKQPTRGRAVLEAFTGPYLSAGIELTTQRMELAKRLADDFSAAYAALCGRSEAAGLKYAPGSGDDFAANLAASAEEERRLRHTLVGPHRDELLLTINERGLARFCSEGQQRSAVIALKMAQAALLKRETGAEPILLLDDVFGELDSNRRTRLLERVLAPGVQSLITTTDAAWLGNFRAAGLFHVEDGSITLA
jgi:DNA replication and repair protein RecF